MRRGKRNPRSEGSTLRLLLVLLLWLAAQTVHAAPPLILDKGPRPVPLERHLSWHCDATGKDTLDSAMARPFTDLDGHSVTLGFRREPCWFRFRVENHSANTLHLILQIPFPALDHIDLFAPGSTMAPVHTGDSEPFSHRPLPTRFFNFPLRLDPGQQQDYYLRVETTSAMNLPLILSDARAFEARQELQEWFTGIGFGIIGGLLFYHLFLWLAVRENVFRFCVPYMAAAFVYLLCINGIAYRLWPDSPDWNSHAQPFFLLLMLSLAALFARDFLGGRAALSRVGERTLMGVGLTLAGLAALQFVLPLHIVYPLQSVTILPVVVIILMVALSQLRRRRRKFALPQAHGAMPT